MSRDGIKQQACLAYSGIGIHRIMDVSLVFLATIFSSTVLSGIFAEFDLPTDNGVAELLVNEYTDKLIEDLNLQRDATSPENQSRFLRDRLKGLYNYLKFHPALMERRLEVGARPPNYTPNLWEPQRKRDGSFNRRTAQSVCPYSGNWRLIYRARDLNDSEVEVKQTDLNKLQWFYVVTCDAGRIWSSGCNNCCFGINHRRFASKCLPKTSYMMALVRRNSNEEFDWNWIQVDSSCSCAVSPLRGRS